MRGKERLRLASVLAATGALALPLALVAPAPSAYAQSVSHRPVAAREVWTDTGVRVRAGTSVTITATGLVHFGSGPISRITPDGVPWGRTCSAIAAQVSHGTWPAPGLSCWSLIGRIGSGKPFEVGARRTLHITQDGELFLGVNDNYLADNSGTWSAAIALSASTSPPTAPSPTSPTIAPAKHGSGGTPLLLILLLVLAVLVAVVVCWRIYAGRHRRSKGSEPVASGDARVATGEAAQGAIPTVPPPAARAAEEAEADTAFVDVNIFQVDLVDGSALRVGYNYFPEGTVVSWRVSQRRATRATGEFVTNGGGSTYHFVTAPFETRLPADSDAADVLFTWTIGDVPFRYSVKRDPG